MRISSSLGAVQQASNEPAAAAPTSWMAIGPQSMSVSLTTVEFVASGSGTLLRYTEQGAFFDGVSSAKGREEGTRGLLEKLAAELERST